MKNGIMRFDHPQYGLRWMNDGTTNKMIPKDQVNTFLGNGWIKGKVSPTKLTWWKRVPEEHEGLVRNQESGPNMQPLKEVRSLQVAPNKKQLTTTAKGCIINT